MKNKIITILFIIYISIFSILGIIIKDNEISSTERRKLSTFPEYTLSSEYVTKLDKYLLDHFPIRDTFRSIKATFNYNILKKLWHFNEQVIGYPFDSTRKSTNQSNDSSSLPVGSWVQ